MPTLQGVFGRVVSPRSERMKKAGRGASGPPLHPLELPGHEGGADTIMSAQPNDDELPLRSIPTHYNGILYRSRLEAKWAHMATDLGMYYQYEPDPVIMPSGARYDVDFFIPGQRVYAEVKGPHNRRLWKPVELHDALLRLDGPGQNLVVVLRPAGPTGCAVWESVDGREPPFLALCGACEGWSFTDIDEYCDYFCRRCGAGDILRNAWAPDTLPMPALPKAG